MRATSTGRFGWGSSTWSTSQVRHDAAKGTQRAYLSIRCSLRSGSENVSKAQTADERKREGGNINKSLLALSRVIEQLSTLEQAKNKMVRGWDVQHTHTHGGRGQGLRMC